MSINFTDHVRYDEAANATEKLANVSEEFFNWSGRTVVVLNKSIVDPDRKSSLNIPLVCFKFLACLTVVIPLTFLILRQLTRSILLPKLEDSSASLRGRVALSSSPKVTAHRTDVDAGDSKLLLNKKIEKKPFIPGKSLDESVDPDVRAFAAKDIPLPSENYSQESYERAKAAMGAVLVDPLEKRVFQKVTDHLKHITFADLTRGLQHIIPQFNEAIGSMPFTAVTMRNKSNDWVTQIALHEGLKIPAKLSIRRDRPESYRSPVYTPVVTLIDDCSYSGRQIATLIEGLCEGTKAASLNPEKGAFPPTPISQFFIVVPFITKQAEARILAAAASNGVDIKIISSGSMPDYKEILSEDEAACFENMISSTKTPDPGTILAYTDWKRPDATSCPESFLHGTMYYTTETGERALYKGNPLVPEIVRPYKPRDFVNPPFLINP